MSERKPPLKTPEWVEMNNVDTRYVLGKQFGPKKPENFVYID